METEAEDDSTAASASAADEEAALPPPATASSTSASASASACLAPPPVRTRRCSARLLSVNVREALSALRQREHKSRVAALVQRRADFYRRQRYCECASMVTILGIFSAFSLYVVFAYGFYVGQRKPFNLVEEPYEHRLRRPQHGSADLWCRSDAYWEWCRWIHFDHYCDFEWMSASEGVAATACDFPAGKVERIGDYDGFECGIRIHNLDVRDRGLWQCEIEKYYNGFSRRYGEVRTSSFMLVVYEDESTNASVTQTHSTATEASEVATNETLLDTSYSNHTIDANGSSAEEIDSDYQNKFFLLKVFVLGGVSLVLISLAVAFWTYFMYLWRSWEFNKRDSLLAEAEETIDIYAEYDAAMAAQQQASLSHSMSQALLQSRRKSVSFAVCTLQDPETMSFDITLRSVPVAPRSRSGSANTVLSTAEAEALLRRCSAAGISVSPTPSAPAVVGAAADSDSLSAMVKPFARRLSLAPEDAIRIHRQRSKRSTSSDSSI